ncbi:MAG: hypothetical protein COV67_00135 [Nitrospinae bacterium CG11_big_fil_rev_8_21_14_0_20_56_8]|nr:MAG: hypothetical protein COV67_00135 [Nitrospinae bacterium CG11_big_fil_rev_8_21_14_0_20_56_8]
MYQDFYAFKEKPFSLTPDPRFLYLSKQHQGALDHMMYGIKQKEGFMVIAGDVGTGKTTLSRCLLDRLDRKVEVALILNPMLSDMDLLRTCVHDLRVPRLHQRRNRVLVGASHQEGEQGQESRPVEIEIELEDPDSEWVNTASKKELLDALNAFLLAQHNAGKSTVLIIDEAQNLPLDVLEQLRILSNLETEKEKLLQIIFVGQLELNDKLKLPELKQLNQRISIRYEIGPLSFEESKNYINHRLLVAGASSRVVFAPGTLKEIYQYSKGYPRLINLVCDRTLLAGFNAQADTLDRSHARQGIRSLLGEEDQNYFLKRFIKVRLPLIVSILFFIGGLAFFILSQMDLNLKSGLSSILSVTREYVKAELPPSATPVKVSLPEAARPPSTPAAAVQPQGESPVENIQEPVQEGVRDPTEPQPAPVAGIAPEGTVANVTNGMAKGFYRIHVDSLKTQTEAEDEVKALAEKGFNSFWKTAVTGGQEWYVVYVGPFEDARNAKIHLNALKFAGWKPILLSVSKAG